MPGSLPDFDNVIKGHLVSLNPHTLLDVGCGSGNYGRLARSVLPELSYLHAIEPTAKYVEDYNLYDTYDRVFCQEIKEFLSQETPLIYDVALCSDVLEHLYLSEAIDVVDTLLYCSRWVMLKWPTGLNQGWHEGNPYEKHKSNIILNDLQRFNIHYYSRMRLEHAAEYHYCVISGMHVERPSLPL